MFHFESGRAVNEEIEAVLQEVQDLLNLVDVLARTTGNFLSSTGGGEDEGFSENVAHWLFDTRQGTNFAALRRRERPQRAAQADQEQYGGAGNANRRNQLESCVASSSSRWRNGQLEFSSLGSSAGGTNLATGYYSSQLVSHHISSHQHYTSPRSRYLDNQAKIVSAMRQRLAAFDTTPKSACELVGPITCSSDTSDKKLSTGRTVNISGGSYSYVKSYVDKSKSLFGDFASPSSPDYKAPWEYSRRGGVPVPSSNRNRNTLGYHA